MAGTGVAGTACSSEAGSISRGKGQADAAVAGLFGETGQKVMVGAGNGGAGICMAPIGRGGGILCWKLGWTLPQ